MVQRVIKRTILILTPLTNSTFFESFPNGMLARISNPPPTPPPKKKKKKKNRFGSIYRIFLQNPFYDLPKGTENPVLDSQSGLGF